MKPSFLLHLVSLRGARVALPAQAFQHTWCRPGAGRRLDNEPDVASNGESPNRKRAPLDEEGQSGPSYSDRFECPGICEATNVKVLLSKIWIVKHRKSEVLERMKASAMTGAGEGRIWRTTDQDFGASSARPDRSGGRFFESSSARHNRSCGQHRMTRFFVFHRWT
jgi:hypothetical protein